MNSLEFFTWAVERDGWHYLKHIEGLSYSVNVMVAGVEAASQIGDGTVVVPISYSYIDLREAVVNLTREKEQNQRQTAKDFEELSNFRDIAAKRSATAADNGRQGGRGKSK